MAAGTPTNAGIRTHASGLIFAIGALIWGLITTVLPFIIILIIIFGTLTWLFDTPGDYYEGRNFQGLLNQSHKVCIDPSASGTIIGTAAIALQEGVNATATKVRQSDGTTVVIYKFKQPSTINVNGGAAVANIPACSQAVRQDQTVTINVESERAGMIAFTVGGGISSTSIETAFRLPQ